MYFPQEFTSFLRAQHSLSNQGLSLFLNLVFRDFRIWLALAVSMMNFFISSTFISFLSSNSSTFSLHSSDARVSLNVTVLSESHWNLLGSLSIGICCSSTCLIGLFRCTVAMMGQWSDSKGLMSPTLNSSILCNVLCGVIR